MIADMQYNGRRLSSASLHAQVVDAAQQAMIGWLDILQYSWWPTN
jgi:hypothetical protein